MFTEIDVTLNGKIISPGTDTYPYKAYLEKLLFYRSNTLEIQMKSYSLWEKDTAGHMNNAKLDVATQSKSQFDVTAGDNPKVTVTAANLELSYPDSAKNEGLRKRHDIIENSKKITLIDRLYLGLFQ